MAKKYFTVTPRIQARLNREIFNGLSIEIYGEGTGRMEREDHFSAVRTALVHLSHHQHYPQDLALGDGLNKIREATEKLLAHEDVGRYYSEHRQKQIQEALLRLINAGTSVINSDFTTEDLQKFADLAIAARAHYEAQGYNPDDFISQSLVAFAVLVSSQFDAWEATLNYEYTERA